MEKIFNAKELNKKTIDYLVKNVDNVFIENKYFYSLSQHILEIEFNSLKNHLIFRFSNNSFILSIEHINSIILNNCNNLQIIID